MRVLLIAVVCVFLLASCGGDDSSGPGANQPPYFSEAPAAVAPGALLLNVVVGDVIGYTARAVDPDVEPVSYLWELVREVDGEYVPATDAGTVTGAQTSQANWSVAEFDGSVRMRCTISDGKDSVFAYARPYSSGTPLRALVVDSDLTLRADQSPYVILDGLAIEAASTLRVEEGVELQVRIQRGTGTVWEKFAIEVFGTLETQGLQANPVVIGGGHSEDPQAGGGTEQFDGIDVKAGGKVALEYTRVQDAETGLRVRSVAASTVSFCNFTECGTGVRVEAGSGTTLSTVLLRDNSTGLQVNSAQVTLDGCFIRSSSAYGINVDASTAPAGITVTGSEFQGNLQAHVRLASLSGQPITATINGSNLLQQTNDAPAINLFSNCIVYNLDLRGNFWGSAVTPAEIIQMFADDKHCEHVSGWVDSDCGGDPDACDWSNTAW